MGNMAQLGEVLTEAGQRQRMDRPACSVQLAGERTHFGRGAHKAMYKQRNIKAPFQNERGMLRRCVGNQSAHVASVG
jgi:hypothetical protein